MTSVLYLTFYFWYLSMWDAWDYNLFMLATVVWLYQHLFFHWWIFMLLTVVCLFVWLLLQTALQWTFSSWSKDSQGMQPGEHCWVTGLCIFSTLVYRSQMIFPKSLLKFTLWCPSSWQTQRKPPWGTLCLHREGAGVSEDWPNRCPHMPHGISQSQTFLQEKESFCRVHNF